MTILAFQIYAQFVKNSAIIPIEPNYFNSNAFSYQYLAYQ